MRGKVVGDPGIKFKAKLPYFISKSVPHFVAAGHLSFTGGCIFSSPLQLGERCDTISRQQTPLSAFCVNF
jgi:hypothetical protein